jgi:hypothetical protein
VKGVAPVGSGCEPPLDIPFSWRSCFTRSLFITTYTVLSPLALANLLDVWNGRPGGALAGGSCISYWGKAERRAETKWTESSDPMREAGAPSTREVCFLWSHGVSAPRLGHGVGIYFCHGIGSP